MSVKFGRKANLVVIPSNSPDGLDLSEMHFRFQVNAADVQSPNNAVIQIFGLSERTSLAIQNEYTRVVLQAGYEDEQPGVIFDGTIKQIRRGKENAHTPYLTLLAADGDIPYNFAIVNRSLAAAATLDDQLKVLTDAMGAKEGFRPVTIVGPVLPRGKVLFGMARDYMRILADTTGTTWSIQNGAVTLLPLTGYVGDQVVVLTARSGLIGRPEQTENGIKARCLLNPRLQIGGLVNINNDLINRTINKTEFPVPFDRYVGTQLLAPVTEDGVYRLYVVEHCGDTRGDEWYSDVTCLAVDLSAPADRSVKRFG